MLIAGESKEVNKQCSEAAIGKRKLMTVLPVTFVLNTLQPVG